MLMMWMKKKTQFQVIHLWVSEESMQDSWWTTTLSNWSERMIKGKSLYNQRTKTSNKYLLVTIQQDYSTQTDLCIFLAWTITNSVPQTSSRTIKSNRYHSEHGIPDFCLTTQRSSLLDITVVDKSTWDRTRTPM